MLHNTGATITVTTTTAAVTMMIDERRREKVYNNIANVSHI